MPSYAATPAGPEMAHRVACGLLLALLEMSARAVKLGVMLGGARAVAVDDGAMMPPGGTFRPFADDPLLPHPAGIVPLFFWLFSL